MENHHKIVGRMEAIWPHQLSRIAMHGKRSGGDLAHCRMDLLYPTRQLAGDRNWVKTAEDLIRAIRKENFLLEIDRLKRRRRKKELGRRLIEGPKNPWHQSRHGALREVILTANKAYFDSDPSGAREGQFERVALNWLRTTFGSDLIHARADHDEAAYHVHAVVLPLAQTKDGRKMLQPSKHKVIANYELFQDEIGRCFAEIDLARGRQWAKEVREARASGHEAPEVPRHSRTTEWRRTEEPRLATGHRELEQNRSDHQSDVAAETERLAVRQRQIDEQAREQDAFAATAEAMAAGFLSPEAPEKFRAPRHDDHAQALLTRIQPSKHGFRRFLDLISPAWAKMQADAAQVSVASQGELFLLFLDALSQTPPNADPDPLTFLDRKAGGSAGF